MVAALSATLALHSCEFKLIPRIIRERNVPGLIARCGDDSLKFPSALAMLARLLYKMSRFSTSSLEPTCCRLIRPFTIVLPFARYPIAF